MLKLGAVPPVGPRTPVELLLPAGPDEPTEAVGAGKTVERTPEPGADGLTDEGETAAAAAVVDGACALPGALDEEAFEIAGSTEPDVSTASTSGALDNEESAVPFFA